LVKLTILNPDKSNNNQNLQKLQNLYVILFRGYPAFQGGEDVIKDNGSFKLVYFEKYPTRKEAMNREKQLKGWTRAKKEGLIRGYLQLLKRL